MARASPGSAAGGPGDEVDELDGAVRRRVGELLAFDGPADAAKLFLDVLARLLQFRRPARARSEGDQSCDVVKGALTGELLADRPR